MEKLIIRRPGFDDATQVFALFEAVLRDTFRKNNFIGLDELLEEEINHKKNLFMECIDSHFTQRFFLIAEIEDTIVGTIEFGPANEIIIEGSQGAYQDLKEVGTVFVLPKFQSKGIGSQLFSAIIQQLSQLDIVECCLDSGYPTAQEMWRRRLGDPTIHMKDHWGEGADHMIWHIDIPTLRR